MEYKQTHGYVNDEERREFLKALGIAGTVAAGGATLDEVRSAVSTAGAEDLASVGQAIQADLGGELDAALIAEQQTGLAKATQELSLALEHGVAEESTGPREEFAAVAEAGRPVYEHMADVGFFESTTGHLPQFTPEFLKSAVSTFVGSEALAEPLSEFDLTDGAGVDLLAEVIANAEELNNHHWVATDGILREELEFGEHIPPMTMGAAGGTLLWLEDLDDHLWRHGVLLTEEIHADAVWHGQSMAAGFSLMAEGARAIDEGDAALSNEELGGLLSTGFAVQAIAQGLLPQDVYWITDEMRASHRPDITVITE
jgi:hypothetical protein